MMTSSSSLIACAPSSTGMSGRAGLAWDSSVSTAATLSGLRFTVISFAASLPLFVIWAANRSLFVVAATLPLAKK
ncbi:hypothetical protein D3C76_1643640 [compost metagenome]